MPHLETGVTPYEAMMNRPVRTKLDYQARVTTSKNPKDTTINRKDEEYKDRVTFSYRKRNTKEHNFIIGDHVLLKQKKKNKWSTVYEPAFYVITRVHESSIAARRFKDDWEFYRDASQYKLVNSFIRESQGQTEEENIIPDSERENLIKNIEEETNQEFIQDNESNISTKETEIIATGTETKTLQDVQPDGKTTIGRKTKKKRKETSVFNSLFNLKTMLRCRDNL